MIGLLGFWRHVLAALLYGALALWQLRQWTSDRAQPAAASPPSR